ncbi:hypothetical protein ABW19_dt0209029 [Dactylella cylindrospora]|nr:hypothetical protein ABW19_dt0209029 [Dactylella cylindrospora]
MSIYFKYKEGYQPCKKRNKKNLSKDLVEPYRNEVYERYQRGESYQEVAAWLKVDHGIDLLRDSLRKYFPKNRLADAATASSSKAVPENSRKRGAEDSGPYASKRPRREWVWGLKSEQPPVLQLPSGALTTFTDLTHEQSSKPSLVVRSSSSSVTSPTHFDIFDYININMQSPSPTNAPGESHPGFQSTLNHPSSFEGAPGLLTCLETLYSGEVDQANVSSKIFTPLGQFLASLSGHEQDESVANTNSTSSDIANELRKLSEIFWHRNEAREQVPRPVSDERALHARDPGCKLIGELARTASIVNGKDSAVVNFRTLQLETGSGERFDRHDVLILFKPREQFFRVKDGLEKVVEIKIQRKSSVQYVSSVPFNIRVYFRIDAKLSEEGLGAPSDTHILAAIRNGDIELIRRNLREKRWYPHTCDKDGYHGLLWAMFIRNPEKRLQMVKFLVGEGLDVNHKTDSGNTAITLHINQTAGFRSLTGQWHLDITRVLASHWNMDSDDAHITVLGPGYTRETEILIGGDFDKRGLEALLYYAWGDDFGLDRISNHGLHMASFLFYNFRLAEELRKPKEYVPSTDQSLYISGLLLLSSMLPKFNLLSRYGFCPTTKRGILHAILAVLAIGPIPFLELQIVAVLRRLLDSLDNFLGGLEWLLVSQDTQAPEEIVLDFQILTKLLHHAFASGTDGLLFAAMALCKRHYQPEQILHIYSYTFKCMGYTGKLTTLHVAAFEHLETVGDGRSFDNFNTVYRSQIRQLRSSPSRSSRKDLQSVLLALSLRSVGIHIDNFLSGRPSHWQILDDEAPEDDPHSSEYQVCTFNEAALGVLNVSNIFRAPWKDACGAGGDGGNDDDDDDDDDDDGEVDNDSSDTDGSSYYGDIGNDDSLANTHGEDFDDLIERTRYFDIIGRHKEKIRLVRLYLSFCHKAKSFSLQQRREIERRILSNLYREHDEKFWRLVFDV